METRKEPRWYGLPAVKIIRPWGANSIVVRPLEPFPLVVIVHRLSGRTLPCDGPQCIFCHHNVPTEDRLLSRVNQSAKGGLAILDLPPTQWAPLQRIVQLHGPLNTVILSMCRPGGAKNSRIELSVLQQDLKPTVTIGAPELCECFEAIVRKNRDDATQALKFGKTSL